MPLTIAHRAGNNREALERAVAAGVDAIEVDLRLDGDRLVARHERRIRFFPLYVDRWHLRWSATPQLTFDELLEKTSGRTSLFLDLKSTSTRAVDIVFSALKRHRRIESTRVSSTYWGLLDRLRQEEAALRLHYSIGDEGAFDRFQKRLAAGLTDVGISIRHSLLMEPRLRRLAAAGIEVFAFHVADIDRARQLVDWGATGIISGDLALLRALKERGEQPLRPDG